MNYFEFSWTLEPTVAWEQQQQCNARAYIYAKVDNIVFVQRQVYSQPKTMRAYARTNYWNSTVEESC